MEMDNRIIAPIAFVAGLAVGVNWPKIHEFCTKKFSEIQKSWQKAVEPLFKAKVSKAKAKRA